MVAVHARVEDKACDSVESSGAQQVVIASVRQCTIRLKVFPFASALSRGLSSERAAIVGGAGRDPDLCGEELVICCS